MPQGAIDQRRFDEDLPKLLRAVEQMGRLLEQMHADAQRQIAVSLRDRLPAVIEDKLKFIESWKESLRKAIQGKTYASWELRNALADMRAVGRVMDFETDWSAYAQQLSAARAELFDLAKKLDNTLRGPTALPPS